MNIFFRKKSVVLHHGVYKKTTSTTNAIFIITGMTIGAGVLGVPYVVAQVGLKVGLSYIVVLGIVMLFLNMMIGEVAVRTKEPMHIPGFAGKYIGTWAKELLSIIIIFSSCGALLAYVVGEGRTLSAIFGGDPIWWSVFFWSIASALVWRGLETAKIFEKVASIVVITLISGLSIYIIKYFNLGNWSFTNTAKFFLPYGVILFALHGAPAIAEAHALLPGDPVKFKRAVFFGSLIPIIVYVLFAFAVVGVTGLQTTEVATIGLGKVLGSGVLLVGNLFAALAMFTGFVGLGIALKQTLIWDQKMKPISALFVVISIPLTLLLLGLNSFISVLDLIGGLFISIEAIMMIIIYWLAKKKGDLDPGKFNLQNIWLLVIPVFLVFTFFTVYSIFRMF